MFSVFGIWFWIKSVFYYIKSKITKLNQNEAWSHENYEEGMLLDVLSNNDNQLENEPAVVTPESEAETEPDFTPLISENTSPVSTEKPRRETLMVYYNAQVIENIKTEGMPVEELMEKVEEVEEEEEEHISIFLFSNGY